jgi:Flp pilus assembly pilin Flp
VDRRGRIAGLARRLRPLEGVVGAVATEYGLLLLLFVALASIVALTAFGFAVLRLFQAGAAAFG